MRNHVKFVWLYLGISCVLTLVWAISIYPNLPHTATGWGRMCALALPATLAAEYLGERLFRNRLTVLVDQETADVPLSFLRIAYGAVTVCYG